MEHEFQKIFDFVRHTAKNKVSLSELKKNKSFGLNIEDLLQSDCSSSFLWIRKYSETVWEIRAKVDIELCGSYIKKQKCNGSCHKLHLCKTFLTSENSCTTPCSDSLSHDLNDAYNVELLKDYCISQDQIEVIRASFPRLCETFLTFGKCNLLACNSLHLCPQYVQRNCPQICSLATKFKMKKDEAHALENQHNTNVLKMFNLSASRPNLLLVNVLANEAINPLQTNSETQGQKKDYLISRKSSQDRRINTKQTNDILEQRNSNTIVPGICRSYLESECLNNNCPSLHICKEYLIQKSRCSGTKCDYGFSHTLKDSHNFKVLSSLYSFKRGDNIFNNLQNKYLRVCRQMTGRGLCKRLSCDRLHICPRYLFEECEETNCKFPHNLLSEHNNKVFQSYKLTSITPLNPIDIVPYVLITKQLIVDEFPSKAKSSGKKNNIFKKQTSVIGRQLSKEDKENAKDKDNLPADKSSKKVFRIKNKERFPPTLCKFYLNGKCSKNDNCSRLHICKEYLMSSNRCTSSQSCSYGLSHDLFDTNNKKIIMDYFDESLDESEIMEKLRQSYPKLCENYGSEKKCENMKCCDLHLCAYFVFGNCRDQNCDFCHDYESQHNQQIFESFNLAVLLNKNQQNFIAPNIFSSKLDFIKDISKKNDGGKLAIKEDQTEEMLEADAVEKSVIKEEKPGIISESDIGNNSVKKKQILSPKHDFVRKNSEKNSDDSTVKKVSSKDHFSRQNSQHDESKNSAMKLSSKQPFNPNKVGNNGNLPDSREAECSTEPKDGPSEYVPPCKDLKTETVIDFILHKDPKGGKCPLDFPELLEKYFNNSLTIAENWFKKNKSQFRKEVNSSNKKYVHVCMVDVEPCHQYWRKTGCTRPNCGRFHICRKLLFQPHNSNRCNFNHDLQNEECQKLLKSNNLSHLSSEQIITLLRKRYPLVCSQHQDNFCSNGDSKCDALHICKDFVFGKCPKDDNSCSLSHEKALSGSQAKRLSKDFNIPLSILRSTLLVEPLNFEMNEDVWGEGETVDLKPVQKDDIIQFIMNLHPTTGDCQLNNPKLLSLFDDNIENAEIWFRKNHSSFRMSKNKQDLVTVHVCLVDVEPCKIYWSKQGCNVLRCGRFHVCRKLLFEKHNANTCSFNHKFDDYKSSMLVRKNNLQKLLPDELVTILKNRFPFVCKEYQSNQCQLGEKFCESLHVCINHLSDNCDGICSKMHDEAFQSEQAKRICTNFSLKEEDLRKTVLFEMVVTMVTDSKTFNPLKEEAICLDYLNGTCNLDSRCSLHHYKTPFMWQYKPIYQQKWIDLSQKVNIDVEKTFCDLNTSSYALSLQNWSGSSINFQQIDDEGCFKDKSTSSTNLYRRLSTRSSVSNDSNSTIWKWYWKKSETEWEEYSNWTDSEKIEKEYLSGNMYCQFTTDEFTYHIMFDEMKQQNRDERYFTKRDVIRRPEYQDQNIPRNPSSRLKSGIGTVFPKTWPSKCAPGHLIDVSGTKRNDLEQKFLQSVSTPVKVMKIQEVCNEEFYEKYLVKKKQIGQKRQTSGEKLLYHGTSHDTVAHICAQNFDFRMSGKNATAYGKGSYFSTSACYSHNYSSCNNQKQYFMFVAQVLVGKYAQGDSSYTRPPPLHHGSLDLYDSCVDNVGKPSMYIVFDRDQCYPRYLITYKLSSDCTNSYSSSYNHSFYNPPQVVPRVSSRQSTTPSSGSSSAYGNRSTSSSATPSASSSYATKPSSFSTANVNSSSTNRSNTSTYSTGQSSASFSPYGSSSRQYRNTPSPTPKKSGCILS